MKQRIGVFKLVVGIVIGVVGTVLTAYADDLFLG